SSTTSASTCADRARSDANRRPVSLPARAAPRGAAARVDHDTGCRSLPGQHRGRLGRTDAVTDTLHLETYGDPGGAPVLAIHGITAFGARFERLAGHLPERRWLCPDLRGHGRSPSTPPWRSEDHVADLLRVLDDEGIDRIDV